MQIKSLFILSLQEKVRAITQTAVLSFDSRELDKINGSGSIHTDAYKKIVFKLQALKLQNPTLRFVDIYRRTPDPTLFEYVADSNSIRPDIVVDDNGDGAIDELDEPIYPGDIYDGSVAPTFVENAFVKSDVAEELEESQWGLTLDASSPIPNARGTTDYALNVSVDVTEFIKQTNLAFIPFAIFVFILIVNLILLTLALVRVWKSRVTFLKELDRQKDELLGIVAHQLAKPITAIRWDLESFLDGDLGKLSDKQTEETKIMRAQAVHLADLTSMILDVSRIQLGKVKLEPQPLDLNPFFKEILDIIEPSAKQKKQNFIKTMPTTLPTVLLDKRYTRMTVENLLTNAVKYTPEGGTVTLAVEIDVKNVLKLTVSDSGVGIPKSEQEKIFGKMYRATNVRNTADGNGFGLYVAKGAIEAQGGKIEFTSEEGKGTAFSIELPLKKA